MTTGGALAQAGGRSAFRRFLARWPTGVTILTTGTPGGPAGCTASTLLRASTDPPLLAVALAAGSGTLAAVRERARFGLSVLGWQQRELADRFATAPWDERFAGLAYRWSNGVPLLDRAVSTAVCVLRDTLPVGDHVLVVGEPIDWVPGPAAPLLVRVGGHSHRLG
jgi:flavin reductase (DIM6/NTAB) family NADH-FMN oxidoreductase RutF